MCSPQQQKLSKSRNDISSTVTEGRGCLNLLLFPLLPPPPLPSWSFPCTTQSEIDGVGGRLTGEIMPTLVEARGLVIQWVEKGKPLRLQGLFGGGRYTRLPTVIQDALGRCETVTNTENAAKKAVEECVAKVASLMAASTDRSGGAEIVSKIDVTEQGTSRVYCSSWIESLDVPCLIAPCWVESLSAMSMSLPCLVPRCSLR